MVYRLSANGWSIHECSLPHLSEQCQLPVWHNLHVHSGKPGTIQAACIPFSRSQSLTLQDAVSPGNHYCTCSPGCGESINYQTKQINVQIVGGDKINYTNISIAWWRNITAYNTVQCNYHPFIGIQAYQYNKALKCNTLGGVVA